MINLHFEHAIVQILLALLHEFKTLLHINLIDIHDCFKQTLNCKVNAYHNKEAFMLSSVLELLYFASMNPPKYTELKIKVSI